MDPYPNPEDLDVLSEPHPFFKEMVRELREKDAAGTEPPHSFADVETMKRARADRKALHDKTYGESPDSIHESVREIPMRDGHMSSIRIYQPADQTHKGEWPVVMLSYGGGFVMGENRAPGPYARGICQLYQALVISITYRLAPEHVFPASINDAWDSLQWLGSHATELGGNPSKGFVVGGISAGGNISAVLSQQVVEQGFSPAITGAWLCVPAIFPDASHVPSEYAAFYKSYHQNAVVPVLPKAAIDAVREVYKPDGNSKWYNVCKASDAHKGLPPTYIQVDGMDPLRDDGIIYEKMLRAHGVKTRLTAWSGLPHAHSGFWPQEEFSRSAVRDTMKGFGWLLGKPEPSDESINAAVRPAATAN